MALVTVTAPGQDLLPSKDGAVLEEAAHAWNSSAPAQWSQMHRRGMTRLRRSVGAPKLLGYVWAYQRRGVLHLHLALAWETELDRIRAKRYVQLLKGGLAHEWCFGFVDLRRPRNRGPRGLASYFAKYVCKEAARGRPELAETVDHDDVPSRPIYISRELTAATRCTMRNLRLRRYYWRARSTRRAGVCECWYVEDMWQRGIRVQAGRLVRTARDP